MKPRGEKVHKLNPEVTLIVPIYNTELYLRRCIDSILNQTFENFELILVNDGSSDGSKRICEEYCEKDCRVILINKKNEGVSVARNVGLDIARGTYIGFVDSDDFIYKDMLKLTLETIKNEGGDIVEFEYTEVKNTNLCIQYEKEDRVLIRGNHITGLTRQIDVPFSNVVWNKLYKKEILSQIRFRNARICEDVEFSYRVMLNVNKYIYISDRLYGYCFRDESLCRIKNYTIDLLDAIYIQHKRLVGLLNNNIDANLIKKAEKRLYFDLIRHYILVYKNIDRKSEHLGKIQELFLKNKSSFFNNKYLKDKKYEMIIFMFYPKGVIIYKDIFNYVVNYNDVIKYQIKKIQEYFT